jgi:hypothetical protein
MNRITIKLVKLFEIEDKILPLVRLHWAEVGQYGGLPDLDIDRSLFQDKEQSGNHITVTMWDDDLLVGYLMVFIHGSFLHKDKPLAHTNGFYLREPYRKKREFLKAFKAMFKYAETILKMEYRVECFTIVCNAKNDLKLFAGLMGYTPSSIEYSKLLR